MNERLAKKKVSATPSPAIQSSSPLLPQRPLTDELLESVGSNSNISKDLGAIQPKTIRRGLNWQNITVEAHSRSNEMSVAGSIQRQPDKRSLEKTPSPEPSSHKRQRGQHEMDTDTDTPLPGLSLPMRPRREAAVKATELIKEQGEEERRQTREDETLDLPKKNKPKEKDEDVVLNSLRAALDVVKYDKSSDKSNKKTIGGVIGIAKTDIPGLEKWGKDGWLIGASPEVRKQSSAVTRKEAGLTDSPPQGETDKIKSPGKIASTQNHAEQELANLIVRNIDRVLLDKGATQESLKDHQVVMHIDQAVCSTCKQGLVDTPNNNVEPGVLKQLSDKYPNLKIIVTNQKTPEKWTIKGGKGTKTGNKKEEEE